VAQQSMTPAEARVRRVNGLRDPVGTSAGGQVGVPGVPEMPRAGARWQAPVARRVRAAERELVSMAAATKAAQEALSRCHRATV